MKNTKRILLLIFITALLLRIGFIILYDNGKMLLNKHYAGDEYSYDQIAINFLNGKGLVTDDGLYARRPPAYPLFLAIIYFIFGHSFVIVRFIQAFIGAFSCVILYGICCQLFYNKAALLVAFISAVYYPFILQPAYLLSEILFTFLLSLCIYFLLYYHNNRRLNILFIASIIFGSASLCKESILYFFFIILVWIVSVNKPKINRILLTQSIFFVGVLLVILPWLIRNFMIYKSFIPTSISGGHALYYGNNPKATGGSMGWNRLDKDSFLPDDLEYNAYSLEADRKLCRLALNYIIKHPARSIFLCFKKSINMWRPYYSDARLINKIVMSIQDLPILIFGTLGLIIGFRKNNNTLLSVLILYFVAVHLITIAEIRYRYPIMPYLIIFSVIGIDSFLVKIKR